MQEISYIKINNHSRNLINFRPSGNYYMAHDKGVLECFCGALFYSENINLNNRKYRFFYTNKYAK